MMCEHAWNNDGVSGLKCQDCGIYWPGHELPVPAHEREGYGELANQPSWRSRVDAMVAELGR